MPQCQLQAVRLGQSGAMVCVWGLFLCLGFLGSHSPTGKSVPFLTQNLTQALPANSCAQTVSCRLLQQDSLAGSSSSAPSSHSARCPPETAAEPPRVGHTATHPGCIARRMAFPSSRKPSIQQAAFAPCGMSHSPTVLLGGSKGENTKPRLAAGRPAEEG